MNETGPVSQLADGAHPRWLRVMAWLAAGYCVVLLGVFVKWQAALLGCFIALAVDVAND